MIIRTQQTHHRPLANSWSYDSAASVRYPPSAPATDTYPEERREAPPSTHKKRPKSRYAMMLVKIHYFNITF